MSIETKSDNAPRWTQASLFEACQSSSKEMHKTVLRCLQCGLAQQDEHTVSLLAGTLDALLQHEMEDDDDNSHATLFSRALVDALWLLSAAQESETSEETFDPLIVLCVKTLSESSLAGGLVRPYMLQTLEPALLQEAGVLERSLPETGGSTVTADGLLKRIRTFNTGNFYKQQKYNLLAEESEGYSKLLSALTTTTRPELIRELMATFHLDPNRCLDLAIHLLALEFLADPDIRKVDHRKDVLLAILQDLTPTNKLPPLLNFQLQNAAHPLRKALLESMAWLIQHSSMPILSVEHMWTFLWGTDEDKALNDLYEQKFQRDLVHLRDMGRVKLSTTSANDDNASKDAPLDLKPLSDLIAVQWLPYLLEQPPDHWSLLDDEQWSKLFVLFPHTLGAAVCRKVRSRVQLWLEVVAAPSQDALVVPPWHSVSNKVSQEMPCLQEVLAVVVKPLSLTIESACIAAEPVLFSQICRLLAFFTHQQVGVDLPALDEFIRAFLLPSLSLFPANPAMAHEVWNVLDALPYRKRYRLYASWRGNGLEKAALRHQGGKPLWLIRGEMEAGKDARYSLKRLSKDTIRDISRAVAKVCFSHPLVVFTTILNQIESYDNLVQVMVDSLRFVTPLSLDVLGFCILSRLAGSGGGLGVNRSRLKEDGVNVSQWLQSLESFAGAFYKRFSMIEFRGILCYLMNRLKEGHVMELGVLRTLLKCSGGWAFADYAPAASLSPSQVEGRAGSTLLQRETMTFGVHVDGEVNHHASQEVRRVLQEQDMGVSLLILLAQVRYQIVYGDESGGRPKPVKLIGNLFDNCQVTMSILLDFLTNATERRMEAIENYAKSLPSLVDLCHFYEMDIASAWMLCRPLVRAAQTSELDGKNPFLDKYKSTEILRKSYEKMLPESTWLSITTELFETFFSHSVYDLFCPEEIYSAEIVRLDKEAERLSALKSKMSPPPLQQHGSPSSAVNEAPELDRVKRVAAELALDLTTQKKHVEVTLSEMEKRKALYFPKHSADRASMATLLTRCIYPRCMQGPDDAMYCAHFVRHLHQLETPGFSTMHFLDCMIVNLSRCLFGLTEGEAANVSILLFETWKVVSRWRYNEESFDIELEGKPGCLMSSDDPIFHTMEREETDTYSSDKEGSPEETEGRDGDTGKSIAISRKDFEHLYNKWHASLGAACLGCLQSSEYMHKRCCLIVLTRMVDVFPTRPKLGNKLLRALEPLQNENSALADIRASAQAYSTQLLKARDDGVWKEEDAATKQARLEKEQAAAAARQKKAQQQMEEMKRESEKITEEIGEWRGRAADSRRPLSRASPPRGADDSGNRRIHDDRRRGIPASSGRTDERWPGRDRPGGGTGSVPVGASYSAMGRRHENPSGSGTVGGRRDEGQDAHRGLEGRWQQRSGDGARGGMKRSRPPSPSEADLTSKRARGSQLEPGEETQSRAADDSNRSRRRYRKR